MRKLTIHFGNRPPIKRQRETASHTAQYYTAAIQNATFKANHIHGSDMLLTFTNPSDSHIFTSLKMSIPITKLLR